MKKSLLFFALVLASYGTIQAQVTTSSMTGVVTETTGHATAARQSKLSTYLLEQTIRVQRMYQDVLICPICVSEVLTVLRSLM